jgi:hypothetical protein
MTIGLKSALMLTATLTEEWTAKFKAIASLISH